MYEMFIIIIKVSTYLFLSVMYTSKYKNHSDNVVFQMRLNSDMEFIADNLQLMLSIRPPSAAKEVVNIAQLHSQTHYDHLISLGIVILTLLR